jgi:predicted house-cleaning noncanonical NTP pyrophosphatase (MazG superfamily)
MTRPLPQIDDPGINSSDSEQAFEGFFTEGNGFISRKDLPDKGCDYIVEMLDKKNITNWRFQVQLKSIEKLKLIGGGKLISYQIKTSQLGYLLNFKPTYGLVVLYSVKKNCLYYDFIDRIYRRIQNADSNEKWKNQQSVTIHVPVSNIITHKSLGALHAKLMGWFHNFSKLVEAQSNFPLITNIGISVNILTDLVGQHSISKALEKYGFPGWNNFQAEIHLPKILDYIDNISPKMLMGSKELLMLAMVVYTELGKNIDGAFYAEKLLLNHNLVQQERLYAEWYLASNQVSRGQISNKHYIYTLQQILANNKVEGWRLFLEIELITALLHELGSYGRPTDEIYDRIENLYEEIDKFQGDLIFKYYFIIQNTQLSGHYCARLILNLQKEWLIANRSEEVDKLLTKDNEKALCIMAEFDSRIANVLSFAAPHFAELEARTKLARGRFYVTLEINNVANKHSIPESRAPKHKQRLLDYSIECLESADIFIKIGLLNLAYTSIAFSLEFIYISRNYYKYQISLDDQYLLERMEEIRKLIVCEKYEFQSLRIIEELVVASQGPYSFVKNINTEEHLKEVAEFMIRNHSFPLEHRINVENELRSLKIFYDRCKDPNISIYRLPNTGQTNQYFQYPSRFYLEDNTTGVKSSESEDLDEILKEFNF